MKIAETYSHLNGLEFLIVHKPRLWNTAIPQELAKKMVGSLTKTCHTAGHEKTPSPNRGQTHRFASGL
ncbi:MAG: hypothetical protein QM845_03425, partial [Verrucomicrobiota bacterium]|nr:hypothetical protein [Verrucomicrobiota bacterium]